MNPDPHDSRQSAKHSDPKPFEESFELRHFSSDPSANGETDFKGPTAIFSTDERVAFLKTYAEGASQFFGDPDLDQPMVTDLELESALSTLRPQPLPGVRQRIPLESWHWQVLPTSTAGHPHPVLPTGIRQESDAIAWEQEAAFKIEFLPQAWRAFFWLSLILPADRGKVRVRVGRVLDLQVQIGSQIIANGNSFDADIRDGERLDLKIELDLASEGGRLNVISNGEPTVQWERVQISEPFADLEIVGAPGVRLLEARGLGFDLDPPSGQPTSADQPFFLIPLFKNDFHRKSDLTGWQLPDYPADHWPSRCTPCVHGSTMEAGEDLILRQSIPLGQFQRATLRVDALDPGGEIWINGRLAHRNSGPHAFEVDVSPWLARDAENLIAIRVYHRGEIPVRMRHTSTDRHTGWFLGRVFLDLHSEVFLDHLFVYPAALGDPSVLAWQVEVIHQCWGPEESEPKADLHFTGQLRIDVAPWYPDAGEVVATALAEVRLNFREPYTLSGSVAIAEPDYWTPDKPRLYCIRATLFDASGKPWDDLAVSTGIRTVSQEGGIFRLNGQPALLFGALLFGTRPPIEDQSKWLRCGMLNHLVRDILSVKALRGNTLRVSVHDSPSGGINDRRLAEIGDQLGILFVWSTNEWVRTSSPWQLDFNHLADDIRQVRNHPSIVMWQPANHPKFESWESDGARWFTKILETILSVDSSRLISPTANFDRLDSPDESGLIGRDGRMLGAVPMWNHPSVVRGNMETPTGYGQEWKVLREWPSPAEWSGEQGWIRTGFRKEYLASPRHACFDFESEESTGQPRWDLHRGQPYYHLRSYETGSEEGSIGRHLNWDEWRISQAWQAFSAYEAYRKKRLLDYDGMMWCSIDGGANTGTYEKPLSDALGTKKLAFHTVRMAFAPTLAGSADVDVCYGPDDSIHPVIFHLGQPRTACLRISIAKPDGQEIASRRYPDIRLPGGRSRIDLPAWRPPSLPDGAYFVIYRLFDELI